MRPSTALCATMWVGASLAAPLAAQTIPIRTVPVASGDQFLLLPSTTMSMGGVRLALDDPIADPWTNPAKGVLVDEGAFYASPVFYSISGNGGGGSTFPIAGLLSGDTWFGGASLALQQIDNDNGRGGTIFSVQPLIDVCCPGCCGPAPAPRRLSDTYGRNLYASGLVGRRLSGPWSVGLGGSISQLRAMDGVDLLYAGADRIEQSGRVSDLRVGLFRAGSRDRLSMLALHSRVSMTHEVSYTEWLWDDVSMQSSLQTRLEANHDETRTWGAHLAWDRALETPGWRIGFSGTLNYKDHPKIPNYTIQNIPRDPGTTWAYEAAAGLAKSLDGTTFGLDVALQPIWSETWQEADAQDVVDSGQRLRVGDRSIENEFFFTNVIVRSGFSRHVEPVTLQAGIEIRSYAYELKQVDFVEATYRDQHESWIEWTPTFGVIFNLDGVDVSWAARVTKGTGRPGTDLRWRSGPGDQLLGDSSDFILAPEGPLTLVDAKVMTHQLWVRVPIR